MPSQYGGNGGNINVPNTLTIQSMSGSGVNPTLVTTTVAHGLASGATVDVYDVDGNTNANGIWPITITSTTQFSIPITGNGTYAAVLPGKVNPITLGATYQIPSDGDAFNAAAFNVAYEALGDRSAFLVVATGGYKMIQQGSIFANDPTRATQWGTLTTTSTAWTPVTTGSGSFTFPLQTLTRVQAGDILVVDASVNVSEVGAGNSTVSLGYANYVPNGTVTPVKIQGSGQWVPNTTSPNLRLLGRQTMGTSGRVNLYFGHEATVSTSEATSFQGDMTLSWTLWRATGVLQ